SMTQWTLADRVGAAVTVAVTAAAMLGTAELRGQPLQSPERSAAQVFELAIVNGRVSAPGQTIRVKKGDHVELRWSSDRRIELHLHGYDLEAKAAPQAPATMAFEAKIAGRFPVTEHTHGPGHHRAIVYLEVHP